MYPILFSIGAVHVFSYGFMIAAGLYGAFLIIQRRGVHYGIHPDTLINVIIATTFVGLMGARIWYVVVNWNVYQDSLFDIVKIWEGGLVLYGGTLCSLVFLYVYSNIRMIRFPVLTDAMVPCFAFVQAFGRIGCFLNGCCAGKETNFFVHVVFPGTDIAVHPTQLYSSLLCFLVAGLLFRISDGRMKTGGVTTVYFLVYPVGRFLIEYIRVNERVLGGFTSAQTISIMLFVGAVCVFINQKYWKRNER